MYTLDKTAVQEILQFVIIKKILQNFVIAMSCTVLAKLQNYFLFESINLIEGGCTQCIFLSSFVCFSSGFVSFCSLAFLYGNFYPFLCLHGVKQYALYEHLRQQKSFCAFLSTKTYWLLITHLCTC